MPDDKKTYINPNYVKEWETSRGVLDRFDGYLNDLRKYGFTLITGLLALSAFLLPYSSQTDSTTGIVTTSNFPDDIKFVVLLINLLIIVAVTALDRNYTVFLKAAATRARVLERALNLELTKIITDRYRGAHSDGVITGLYGFYMLMVLVLGIAVLGHNLNLFIPFLSFFLAGLLSVGVIRHYIRVKYRYGPIDYTVDRLQCTQGDTVAITLTNLEKIGLRIESGITVYEIRSQAGTTVARKTVGDQLEIGNRESYTWLWDGKKNVLEPGEKAEVVERGVYEVWRPKATEKQQSIMAKIFGINQQSIMVKIFGIKEVYNEIVKNGQGKAELVLFTKPIRVYEKATKPRQTDSDKKLEMIKKMLS